MSVSSTESVDDNKEEIYILQSDVTMLEERVENLAETVDELRSLVLEVLARVEEIAHRPAYARVDETHIEGNNDTDIDEYLVLRRTDGRPEVHSVSR